MSTPSKNCLERPVPRYRHEWQRQQRENGRDERKPKKDLEQQQVIGNVGRETEDDEREQGGYTCICLSGRYNLNVRRLGPPKTILRTSCKVAGETNMALTKLRGDPLSRRFGSALLSDLAQAVAVLPQQGTQRSAISAQPLGKMEHMTEHGSCCTAT
jgi:hypothetical protein